ncbi:Hypothetical predicted protein [Xyrichtys novacula]|uniref:Uncharacterized protein n=1 Tax=Xyrichtys novacula TaxID=13765 RepID=A0AAV1FPW7_XYRNO|nr:Hypothetical predicted protein [Xyrichtys novacula]
MGSAMLVLSGLLMMMMMRMMRSEGPMEDNIYVVMHGNHGNKKNMEEKKQEKEEESPYVTYMGAPITEQRPTEEEDVYV